MLKRRMMSSASALALMCGGAFPSGASAQCEPAWSDVGGGMSGSNVNALLGFDDGSGAGPALYAAGGFVAAGGTPARAFARWDGAAWSALGSGSGPDLSVRSLAAFSDGPGADPALYAGGWFKSIDDMTVNGIAKWDGSNWSGLGSGLVGPYYPSIIAMAIFDDGSGAGSALYAGGDHFFEISGISANRIARWDGATWAAPGSGMNSSVQALVVFDDGLGSGPALYAAGGFAAAGGAPASRIAKWDGVRWMPLGSGLSSVVYALAVFDDGLGGGPALYAAGFFTAAGGRSANRIAKWDGVSWSPLGSGLSGENSQVFSLAVFDDGSGEALYAGGNFSTAGGLPAQSIAKWDGAAWSPVGSGMDNWVNALTVFDDGSGGGPALYAGGYFSTAGGQSAYLIARWGCEAPVCYADCDESAALDFFDFLCFQNLFAAADPGADCDESGAHDFFDFLCFQNAFAAGCP